MASKKQSNDLEVATKLREKLDSLKHKEEEIDKEINLLKEQGVPIDDTNAEIEALHKYNEMKDLTQNIIGFVASMECTTLSNVHKRYNLPLE